MLAHGWNNDKAEAGRLYDALCANIERVLDAEVVPGIGARTPGVLRLYWPSKKFADADLIPGGVPPVPRRRTTTRWSACWRR